MAMLRAFEVFGHYGGIRKTAQHLDVDHAVISRHLRALEAFVGTALINRNGGKEWLTPEGLAYHEKLSLALREIADATDTLRHRDKHHLVVWCAPGFAYLWLIRRLSEFHALYPEIELELRPSDHAPNFAMNEADADIRYIAADTQASTSGIKIQEIARPLVFPVASPAYHASIADRLIRLQDFLGLRLLHEENDTEWRLWLEAQGIEPVASLPGPRLWHAHLAIDAARNGQGIALANHLLLGDDLVSGRLVALQSSMEVSRPIPLGAYCVTGREDRWTSPSLVRFRQWLKSELN